MGLLPRSPRGTLVLAAAVWLGGSVATWLALPARPRAVIPADVAFIPSRYPASGRALLGEGYGTCEGQGLVPRSDASGREPRPESSWQLRDAATGRCLASWP